MATAKKAVKTPAAPKVPARKIASKPVSAPMMPTAAAAKADKPKKPKLVRDSFTIPKIEYSVLETLKLRAVKAGAPAKKSEVLRAGIKALAGMSDEAFLAALGAVPAIKTGRPAKS